MSSGVGEMEQEEIGTPEFLYSVDSMAGEIVKDDLENISESLADESDTSPEDIHLDDIHLGHCECNSTTSVLPNSPC